ncbi:proteasome subunit beta [Candidatus Mancarchaeum acidiphilum]|uniref:Proteasome subunit beta n=1 Tax=Candidatus Mancarchaeum acidiphilum TaxID=1920749 RepID=A0A218NM74_9ARCH|nr:archaeal proteasome endopeptidase complex subunit beta [Candidatus Mancarchaeum acidiphilum]ASI13567.1 proteasome subunit beta [Candidatus Mancarchaeum acidiphilum]
MDEKALIKYMKGTTTVGIICKDGVVLGADSRATMDTFIASKEARKVWQIDENIGMTIAGGVGDAEEIIRVIKIQNEIYKMNENKMMSPKVVTNLLSIILQQNKMMPFMVQLIVGGVDSEGKPQLFNLDPVGGYTDESKFTSTGSGSLEALGYLEDAYKDNLTVKDGIRIAKRAVSIAMSRDSATGNNIAIAAITKNGYKEYSGKELEKEVSSSK